MKKVGALWYNKTKEGKTYMKIKIGKYQYLAFKNENAEGNQPAYVIYSTYGDNENYNKKKSYYKKGYRK